MTTLAALSCCQTFFAQKMGDDEIKRVLDSISASYKYQTGQITIGDGMATLNIPAGFRYLDAQQSKQVLEDIWGNPPGQTTMGMIFPENLGPLDSAVWAFDLSFEEMGYVKDADADDINYDDLLNDMKKENAEENKQRTEMGYESVEFVGWASTPFYDKEKKVLHWAKELKFGDAEANTLNYDVRVLGRKGVLSMNAIGMMDQLSQVNQNIPAILSSVAFAEGNRYADFSESSGDKIAAWTIGGLVAGKVLAKAGFFAIIAKFGKVIILALIAGGAALWKYITGRRNQEEDGFAGNTGDSPQS
jgi:uncharacterized membrane-anchored protein